MWKAALVASLVLCGILPACGQTPQELRAFFRTQIGLSEVFQSVFPLFAFRFRKHSRSSYQSESERFVEHIFPVLYYNVVISDIVQKINSV